MNSRDFPFKILIRGRTFAVEVVRSIVLILEHLVFFYLIDKLPSVIAACIVTIELPFLRIAASTSRICIVITRSDGVAHRNSCLAGFEDDIGAAAKLAAPLREIAVFLFAIKEISVTLFIVAFRITL